MDSDQWLGLAAVLVCLFLLALSAGAEGWFSSQQAPAEGAATGPWRDNLLRLFRQARLRYSTVTLFQTLALGGYATALAFLALRLLGPNRWRIAALVVVGLLAVQAVRWVAWNLASAHPQQAASLLCRPLILLAWLVAPLRKGLDVVLSRLLRFALTARKEMVGMAPEVPPVLGLETTSRPIEAEEREMIQGIIGMEARTVRDVMVPRIDIFSLDVETPLQEAVRLVVAEGYSRVPVYRNTIDEIVGVLYAKDLLRYLHLGQTRRTLVELVRPAFFIPDSKKVDELFREMRQRRVHLSIVVDEYGGTAGVVTIEDLLEEIVGEIQDEFDAEEPLLERVNEREVLVSGRMSIRDLNDVLGLEIQSGDFDTVAGLLQFRLGRLPASGDEVEFDGSVFRVLSTDGRRVNKVRVSKRQQQEGPDLVPSSEAS